jgi:hypothetical protein
MGSEWQIPARWLVSACGILIPFPPKLSFYSEGTSWSSGIDRGGLMDVLGPSLDGLLGVIPPTEDSAPSASWSGVGSVVSLSPRHPAVGSDGVSGKGSAILGSLMASTGF